eukprot:m.52683 g.52683  ORF g.52683 m.52683 type:complete len:51 (+) comp48501_c0_seq6:1319-1471(+)
MQFPISHPNTLCFTIEATSSFIVVNSSLGVALGYSTQCLHPHRKLVADSF